MEIDDTLLVKIYTESFDRGYHQDNEEKESISKLEFRFQNNILAMVYISSATYGRMVFYLS